MASETKSRKGEYSTSTDLLAMWLWLLTDKRNAEMSLPALAGSSTFVSPACRSDPLSCKSVISAVALGDRMAAVACTAGITSQLDA